MRNANAPEARKKVAVPEFLPAVMLAVAIVVSALFAYPDFYTVTAKKDEYVQASNERETKSKELAELNVLKSKASEPIFAEELERYAGPYREDSIITSLFSGLNNGVLPLSIALDRGNKLPNGLSQGSVELGLRVGNQAVLLRYVNYLTSEKAKKRYVIKSMSFPFDSTSPKIEPFNVSISLGFTHHSKP